jgi:hypothetical protein
VAAVVAIRRRDPLIVVPLAVVGGGLAFDLAGYLNNSIIWAFRYMIATVPLAVLLTGVILAASPSRRAADGVRPTMGASARHSATGTPRRPAVRHGWVVGVVGVIVALVALGPSIPATAAGMFNPAVGSEELQELGYVFHHPLTAVDRIDKQHFAAIQSISAYLAGLRLPEGDILVDNSSGCVPEVITTVPDPKIFVIPNDRDFQRALADPLTFHVHFIIVPPPTGANLNTATLRAYPNLYVSGAGFTEEVHQFRAQGLCPAFRMYRVVGHPGVD